MHQTHYWPCLGGCGKKLDGMIFDRFFGKGHFKCPDANKWRKVIDSKLPRCKSSETEQAYKTLQGLGLAVNGSHGLFTLDDKSVEGMSVIRVNVIEDTLEDLMKHQAVDGARYHGYNQEIMCPDCIARLRKEAYSGTEEIPAIKCPVCDSELVPLHPSLKKE